MTKFIASTWELRSYDVWGNARDGFEVNDSHVFARDVPLRLTVETFNPGTPHEFQGATPSDAQIRRLFDCARVKLDTDGDDVHIYITRRRDGFPIGEMFCTSHASLSPIRKE